MFASQGARFVALAFSCSGFGSDLPHSESIGAESDFQARHQTRVFCGFGHSHWVHCGCVGMASGREVRATAIRELFCASDVQVE